MAEMDTKCFKRCLMCKNSILCRMKTPVSGVKIWVPIGSMFCCSVTAFNFFG